MAKAFECGKERLRIPGKDEHELVANEERHLAQAHSGRVGKLSRQQILATAQEV